MRFHPRKYDQRIWLGLGATLGCLWLIVWGSRWVLTAFPHLSGGIERLHWFAYIPCLVGVARFLFVGFQLIGRRTRGQRASKIGTVVVAAFIVLTSLFYQSGVPSPLSKLRGANNLLDFELAYNHQRCEYLALKNLGHDVSSTRPPFVRNDDVALLLEIKGKDTYWWIKQGAFWSDSYAEAFAFHERGEAFLADRKHFYALVDRVPLDSTADWLRSKGVTLIVDRSTDADEYLRSFFPRFEIPASRVSPGVWRLD